MSWRDGLLWFLVILIAIGVIGAWLERRKPTHVDSPIVIVDTVWKERIVKDTVILVKTREISTNDTVWVYLPGDTVKVPVSLPFTRKTYEGEFYSLSVSGYKPQLDDITLKFPEPTIRQTQTKTIIEAPKIQAGLIAGYLVAPGVNTEFIGARFRRNWNRFNLEGSISYSPSLREPVIGISAGFDLIKR